MQIAKCKEIEENNRIGKIRDFFKKIRDTKGIFHAKMSSIKDIRQNTLKVMNTFPNLKETKGNSRCQK